ncbi:MAG: exodeoxyribonuclease VII small subunit [Planctomycetota bacterium]
MAKRPKTDSEAAPAELSYEQALGELEGIVRRIESGEVTLDESLASYERGAALVERCRALLDRAEQRIEELGEAGSSGGPSRADDG